ncbi:MAG: DUF86 domain-containing protein [bacterium]|nr:DUF86 domain-containing protein [bacterium]
MINRRLVQERLDLILDYAGKLELWARTPEAEFTADWVKVTSAESCLRKCLEAIMDVGRHVLAKTGSAFMAEEYRGIGKGLARQAVVDQALGDKLVLMAGYRNRLVHLYGEVTAEELHAILTSNLADLREFVRQIAAFLDAN